MKVTAGSLAKECCCGGTASSCTGGDPEVYLTIFDADYAGGGITWCGVAFSQSDIQNATERGPVCPTLYTRERTYTLNPYVARNTWAYNASLRMARGWSGFTPASNYPVKEQQIIGINNTAIAAYRKDSISLTFSTFQIGVLTAGIPVPTWNSYAIVPNPLSPTTLDIFFGSYTEAGIQYSWRRGNGW